MQQIIHELTPWLLAGLGFVCTILGWFARVLWEAVKDLRRDLDALRVYLAQEYPSYKRLEGLLEPITKQLDRIEEALRGKVDKP